MKPLDLALRLFGRGDLRRCDRPPDELRESTGRIAHAPAHSGWGGRVLRNGGLHLCRAERCGARHPRRRVRRRLHRCRRRAAPPRDVYMAPRRPPRCGSRRPSDVRQALANVWIALGLAVFTTVSNAAAFGLERRYKPRINARVTQRARRRVLSTRRRISQSMTD